MSVANTNNATPGTSDGTNLIATLGNDFLSAVASLGNVGTSLAEQASSALKGTTGLVDSFANLRLAVQNANKTPASTIPNSQVQSVADYVANPANVQKLLWYGFLTLSLGAGAWWVVKKW